VSSLRRPVWFVLSALFYYKKSDSSSEGWRT
jgi:hypothetical protein